VCAGRDPAAQPIGLGFGFGFGFGFGLGLVLGLLPGLILLLCEARGSSMEAAGACDKGGGTLSCGLGLGLDYGLGLGLGSGLRFGVRVRVRVSEASVVLRVEAWGGLREASEGTGIPRLGLGLGLG
jgi:hypothetical protein